MAQGVFLVHGVRLEVDHEDVQRLQQATLLQHVSLMKCTLCSPVVIKKCIQTNLFTNGCCLQNTRVILSPWYNLEFCLITILLLYDPCIINLAFMRQAKCALQVHVLVSIFCTGAPHL